MAVERAQSQKDGEDNLTWGTFVSNGVASFLGAGSSKTKADAKADKKESTVQKSSKTTKKSKK